MSVADVLRPMVAVANIVTAAYDDLRAGGGGGGGASKDAGASQPPTFNDKEAEEPLDLLYEFAATEPIAAAMLKHDIVRVLAQVVGLSCDFRTLTLALGALANLGSHESTVVQFTKAAVALDLVPMLLKMLQAPSSSVLAELVRLLLALAAADGEDGGASTAGSPHDQAAVGGDRGTTATTTPATAAPANAGDAAAAAAAGGDPCESTADETPPSSLLHTIGNDVDAAASLLHIIRNSLSEDLLVSVFELVARVVDTSPPPHPLVSKELVECVVGRLEMAGLATATADADADEAAADWGAPADASSTPNRPAWEVLQSGVQVLATLSTSNRGVYALVSGGPNVEVSHRGRVATS